MFYAAKKPKNIGILMLIVISKLVKGKANSKYLIGYLHLDKYVRTFVLIMPKINGCSKTFKVKDGD